MYVCKEGVHDLHAYGLKKAISGKLPCIVSSMCIYFEGACKSDLPILIERHRKIAGGAKDTRVSQNVQTGKLMLATNFSD